LLFATPSFGSVAESVARPIDSTLIEIPGRSQDDEKPEKLTFLSSTLGSHMVLQQAPQQAVVWGFTAPGAKVTTVMVSARTTQPQTFVCTADSDGTWRQTLPAIAASKTSYNFSFSSSSPDEEKATMVDVLFGDVYICGGQSNMEFAMPAVANASMEKQEANNYPNIRFFTVGHGTSSPSPLRNLQTTMEPWQVASNLTINKDAYPGHTLFSTFSAVCWLFGKHLSQQLSPTGEIPIGLISNNWGGTKVEVWTPSRSYSKCNRSGDNGPMYNAMILPYAVGPMTISGFTWYQGEANTANATTAEQYACLFPEMITAWREDFKSPSAYFGFVQLSTWCSALNPASLPEMRDAQMAALKLPNVGYATNADHGMGCTIHPAAKQYCSVRLANSALAIKYNKGVQWQSPTYRSATQVTSIAENQQQSVSLTVDLNHVSGSGLHTVYPFNYNSPGYGPAATQIRTVVNCSDTFPVGHVNVSMETQCAWASLQISGVGWVNASVSIHPSGQQMMLTAMLPSSSSTSTTAPTVEASAYGWGPIPMMSAYDQSTALPVLPWNTTVSSFVSTF